LSGEPVVHDAITAAAEVPGLVVERRGAVLRIRLSRPDKRNALSREMVRGLLACIEHAPDDEALRVIDLAGEGGHLCGGADWVAGNAPSGARPRVGAIARRMARESSRLVERMLRVQLPIVCRVRGWAAGIGCHLALASDFAVAAEDARFWEPFVERGFTPYSGGSWLLPRLVGVARARRMLLLGEQVDGRRAADWGLIHEAVAADALDATCDALVARLARAATASLGLTRQLLAGALDQPLAQALEAEAAALELSARSLDFKEGLAAFREGRDPDYQGR